MKVLDFTNETDELENKLIKLGFRYQSTDEMVSDGLHISSRLTITWVNVIHRRICKHHGRLHDTRTSGDTRKQAHPREIPGLANHRD